MNSQNDRETDGYTAEDYVKCVTDPNISLGDPLLISAHHRVIVRTLNTPYQRQYAGLGEVLTTYPVSAFVTHLLYLRGTLVPVDVHAITVGSRRSICTRWLTVAQALGVKCVEVVGPLDAKSQVPKFSASSVRRALLALLEEDTSA